MKLTEIVMIGMLAVAPAMAEEEIKTPKKQEQIESVSEKELKPSDKALKVDWDKFREDEYVKDVAYQKLLSEEKIDAQGEVDYNYLRKKYMIRKFKESYSHLKRDSKKGREYLKLLENDFELTMSFAASQKKITKIIGEGPEISQKLDAMGEGYREDTERTYEQIEKTKSEGAELIKEIEARTQKSNEELTYWKEKGKTAEERLESLKRAKEEKERKIEQEIEEWENIKRVIQDVFRD